MLAGPPAPPLWLDPGPELLALAGDGMGDMGDGAPVLLWVGEGGEEGGGRRGQIGFDWELVS